MGLQFSHSVGYRGVCSVSKVSGTWYAANGINNFTEDETSRQVILCTGGNISLTQEPIMGSGVWGAGYMNVAPIAYAYNYLALEGSCNYELTARTDGKSEDNDMWHTLRRMCVVDKAEPSFIRLLPDGHNGFQGGGWASSLSFEASEGAAITGSFNFKGDPHATGTTGGKSGFSITADGDAWASSATPDQLRKGELWAGQSSNTFAGETLIPYWRTGLKFDGMISGVDTDDGTTLKDLTAWSINYNSDLQMLKCIRYETTSPLSADYILCGEASCDGSYTIFRLAGNFAPGAYHKRRQNLTAMLNMGTQTSAGYDNTGATYSTLQRTITIPYVLISSGSTSMTTGAQYVTTEFSFTGLGDGINAIIAMSD